MPANVRTLNEPKQIQHPAKKMHVRTRHVKGAKGRGLPATDLEPRRRRRAVDAGAGLLLPQERSAVAPLQEQGGGGVGAEEGMEKGREPRDGERGLGFVEREEGLNPQEECGEGPLAMCRVAVGECEREEAGDLLGLGIGWDGHQWSVVLCWESSCHLPSV